MDFPPLITRKRTAIIAITNSMWMIPPELYPKKPMAQRISKITATT